MKRIILLIILIFFVLNLIADDLKYPLRKVVNQNKFNPRLAENSRDFEIEIIVEPMTLINSYYDYFPSCTKGLSLQIQPYEEGGGRYFFFHAQETPTSTRRTYYAYINPDGTLVNCSTIGTENIHEGYPHGGIDPVTGDPFVAWHNNYGIVVSYDLFHVLGTPGLWREPFIVISDSFLWPIVHLGPSPIPDKRRIYVVGKNGNPPIQGESYTNAILAFADFDINDLNSMSTFIWTYRDIMFTEEPYTEPYDPYNYTFTISEEGQLAFVGYTYGRELFAFYNGNYGMGDFEYYSESYEFPVENPLNLDGTPRFVDENGQPYDIYFAPYLCQHINAVFVDDDSKIMFPGNMALLADPNIWFPHCLMYPKVFTYDVNTHIFSFYDLHIEGQAPGDNNPMLPWDLDENGIIDNFDENGLVTWEPCWSIYYPDSEYAFHLNNFKITRNDDGVLAVVWNDGTKAKLADLGIPGYEDWLEVPEIALSVSWDAGCSWDDTAFMNSIETPELAGMIPVYPYPGSSIQDLGGEFYGLDLAFYNDFLFGSSLINPGPNPGGELVFMQISFNYTCPPEFWVVCPMGGEEWIAGNTYTIEWYAYGVSGPFDIDLLKNDEFYLDIADNISSSGYDWTIPITIEPDDDYKVRVYGSNPPIYTTSYDYFSILEPNSVDDIAQNIIELYQNYPNPFNPETTIIYQLPENKQVELIIYNIKGQKVKTLVDKILPAGEHSIIWHSSDENDSPVASGIYFYKLMINNETKVVKKMMLIK